MSTPVDVQQDQLATAIRRYRQANILTQDELAARVGVGARTLRGWESRTTRPSYASAKRLVAAGIVTSAQLMTMAVSGGLAAVRTDVLDEHVERTARRRSGGYL